MNTPKQVIFRARTDPHLYDACRREFERLGTDQAKVINMLMTSWLRRAKPPLPVPSEKLVGQPRRRKDIWLNAALYEETERRAKADGLPVATWIASLIQSALMADVVLLDKELFAFEEQIREVAAIGRNLNQIARHLNTDYVKGEPPDVTRLKIELIEELQREIRRLRFESYALIRARRQAWGGSDECD